MRREPVGHVSNGHEDYPANEHRRCDSDEGRPEIELKSKCSLKADLLVDRHGFAHSDCDEQQHPEPSALWGLGPA